MRDPDERILARLRAGIESWNQGLLSSAPGIWHDDILWVEPPGFPDAGTHRGRDACVARMRERLDLLGAVQIDVVRGEARGKRFLIEVVVRGQGAASGAPAQQPEYWVYEFAEDRRVLLWLEFLDRDQALVALAEGAG
ncbi:MAG TPA: nuclear transport factor 2 family protein [Solirubrobacterales bacterium]